MWTPSDGFEPSKIEMKNLKQASLLHISPELKCTIENWLWMVSSNEYAYLHNMNCSMKKVYEEMEKNRECVRSNYNTLNFEILTELFSVQDG